MDERQTILCECVCARAREGMGGLVYEWMDGWMNGWMDGWMDEVYLAFGLIPTNIMTKC